MGATYIEEVRKYPDSELKIIYLKDLRILKGNMSLSRDGYDTPAVVRSISVLRKKYPLAYTVFEKELRGCADRSWSPPTALGLWTM